MVQLSGGLGAYLRLYPERVRMDAPLTPFGGGGFGIVIRNLAFVVGCCWIGLLGAGVLAVAEFLSWLRGKGDKWSAIASRREALQFLAWWVMPMILFGIVVITVMPGYVLCYFPGLAILAGLALCRLIGRIDRAFGGRGHCGLQMVVGGIAGINIAVFVLSPQGSTWLRGNLPLAATEVRNHDRQLGQWFQAIHGRFRPDEVVICHHNQSYFYGFLHFEYHLPEYENWLLTTDTALRPPFNHQLWRAKGHQVEFVDRFEPREHKTIILVVSPGGRVDEFAPVLDVRKAKKWEIPDSAPLYTLTVGAE
jgi:hypothetical protein